MLFLSVCLVFHPAVPCCTHFGRQEHLDLRRVDVHVKGTLEFQGFLQWFNSERTSRSGNEKKTLLMNLWGLFLKGAQGAQRKCVEQPASPPAFSRTDVCVCQSDENEPCRPPVTCRLSLHCGSASNQSTDTVHFHRFTWSRLHICICYIWSLSETCTFPSGLTETSECLCTVYLLLCISAVPEHGGDPEKQIQAQHCLETSAKTLL